MLPAAFLAAMEENLEQPIGRYFDLIAGTSTGGIIATGLALGMSAAEILEFYERDGPAIFADSSSGFQRWLLRRLRAVRHVAVSKYNSEKLREALGRAVSAARIGDAQTRLVLPAWNPASQRVYIYKTAHHPRLSFDYKERAVDAMLATASAPTYFRQHVSANNVGLLDGGVWANNPIAVATVEATAILGWDRQSLHILSLGCLDEIYTLPTNPGWGTLNLNLIKLFMDGQKHGAMGIAKLLTGHEHEREAIHRVDHTVTQGRFALDDTSKIRSLRGIGYSRARELFPKLAPVFFGEPAEPFEPYYSLAPEAAQ